MPGALPGQVKLKDIDGYAYNEDGTYKTDKHGIPLRTGKARWKDRFMRTLCLKVVVIRVIYWD